MNPRQAVIYVACALIIVLSVVLAQPAEARNWALQIQLSPPWSADTLDPELLSDGKAKICGRPRLAGDTDVAMGLAWSVMGQHVTWRAEWAPAKERLYCHTIWLPKCANGQGIEVTAYVLQETLLIKGQTKALGRCRP